MTKVNKTICIDDDIVYNQRFREIVQTRSFSSIVNDLIRSHLKISKEQNTVEENLKQQIQDIEVHKAELEKQLQKIENSKPKLTEQEKLEGWFIDEKGVKWKVQQ